MAHRFGRRWSDSQEWRDPEPAPTTRPPVTTAAPDVLATLKAKINWLEDELSRVQQFLVEHTSATSGNQESQDT